MKILITRNADISNYGGAETFILELSQKLQNEGHEVVVGTSITRLKEKLDVAGVENIRLPWMKWQKWHGIYTPLLLFIYEPWQTYLTWWYVNQIRRHRPDVIHTNNRDEHIAATMAGRLMNVPVVWTDHADLKHEFKNVRRFKNILGKALLYFAKRADQITVVSNAERDQINLETNSALDDRIEVVYNGVPKITARPKAKDKNTIVLGLTARIRNQKGLRELIDSFKQLKAPKFKKLELWMVGDGPDLEELKQRAGDDERIKFLGFQESWLHYIAAMDIFVFPSYTEGFSLSLLEAAALKKPIVATNVGGNPEIIQHEKTGLLIESKDVEGLTKATQRLLDNPKLAEKLAERAHKKWAEEFDFDKIVTEKYIPIYKRVAGK